MPYNRELLTRVKKDRAEAYATGLYKAMSQKPFAGDKPSLYWLVNTLSNKRSNRPVTLTEATAYMQNAARIYKLVPVK